MRGRPAHAAAALALGALAACAGTPPPSGVAGPAAWVWGGERRIEGQVVVPAGVTLRLEPGTVLSFAFVDADGDGVGDAGLHVLGRLEAVGAPGAPVVFTSAEAEPRPGDWRGLLFDGSRGNRLEECLVEYAEHGLHAHFSEALVRRCRLERNVEGTRLGNAAFTIEHSRVSANASKGLNFFACSNRIRRNLVTGNADGLFLFDDDADSVVEENNIHGNERYDVRLGDFTRAGKRLGPNWLGTADPEVAAGRIYDGADDPSLGVVEVELAPAPFDTGWERGR